MINLETNTGTGLRYNIGKLRYDLVHPFAHEQMVRVLTKGAQKYDERNWEGGMPWSTIIASLERHLAAIKAGEIPFEPHCYITARSVDPVITQAWLDKNMFPKAPLYCVGHGESKIETAKKSGINIMVDDSIANFLELTNAGIFTYLYDTAYNKKYNVGHRRIKSLRELI